MAKHGNLGNSNKLQTDVGDYDTQSSITILRLYSKHAGG